MALLSNILLVFQIMGALLVTFYTWKESRVRRNQGIIDPNE